LVEFWGSYAADPLFRIVTIWPAIYYWQAIMILSDL